MIKRITKAQFIIRLKNIIVYIIINIITCVHDVSMGTYVPKRSPRINRNSRVLYPGPGPGFLSSVTWPLLSKKH